MPYKTTRFYQFGYIYLPIHLEEQVQGVLYVFLLTYCQYKNKDYDFNETGFISQIDFMCFPKLIDLKFQSHITYHHPLKILCKSLHLNDERSQGKFIFEHKPEGF